MSGMSGNGRIKLTEECGELVQALMKFQAYPDSENHPDGSNPKQRLTEEIADVLAAIEFVCDTHQLDRNAISQRVATKLMRYEEWHKELVEPSCSSSVLPSE